MSLLLGLAMLIPFWVVILNRARREVRHRRGRRRKRIKIKGPIY